MLSLSDFTNNPRVGGPQGNRILRLARTAFFMLPRSRKERRVQKAVLAVALALTLALFAVTWARPQWIVPRVSWIPDGERVYDHNGDGRPDYVEIWRNGQVAETRQDTNADGRFESTTRFHNGEPVEGEYDLDGDGIAEVRSTFGPDKAERFWAAGPTGPPADGR
jgi:hypothetical protein